MTKKYRVKTVSCTTWVVDAEDREIAMERARKGIGELVEVFDLEADCDDEHNCV